MILAGAQNMENREAYKESYLILFRAVTKALEQMKILDFSGARNVLIRGQQEAEEAFLAAADE